MSDLSPLHPVLIEKFTHAFGPPHRSEGKDNHWALRSLRYVAAINVLLNGSSDCPVVWVFDPHDPTDGVSHQKVLHESEIDGIIERIENRVRTATRPPRDE